MLSVATALLLLFVSLKQAPQPEWQGFVKVRGLQVRHSSASTSRRCGIAKLAVAGCGLNCM